MFAFITKYLSYVVLAIVIVVGVFIWIQSERIDSLNKSLDEQKQLITNQANEIASLREDYAGLQLIDQSRSDNRAELQDLKNRVSALSEADAKKDPIVAETQIKATVNALINDISEATK